MHLFKKKKKKSDNKNFLVFNRNSSVKKILVNCDPLTFYWNKTNPKEKDFPQLRCWWGICGDNLQQHSGLFQEYNTQTLKPHSAVEYFSFQTTDLSCWDVRFRSALISRRGSEGQTMSPLTCFWPPPSQQQSPWKKRCWLLTGQPAFSCWVEFKPWFE